jgi:hypothetical protein
MRGMSLLGSSGQRAIHPWPAVLRDAAIVVLACAFVAITSNSVRSDGIPLLQRDEYQILVPCPETAGEAPAVTPEASGLQDPNVLVVDARAAQAFAQWHVARAINVPFDYLEPTPPDVIRHIASSGAREVLAYGDGNDPDSGEQLARELSGKGIRNVRFVSGGAPALMVIKQQGSTP